MAKRVTKDIIRTVEETIAFIKIDLDAYKHAITDEEKTARWALIRQNVDSLNSDVNGGE